MRAPTVCRGQTRIEKGKTATKESGLQLIQHSVELDSPRPQSHKVQDIHENTPEPLTLKPANPQTLEWSRPFFTDLND